MRVPISREWIERMADLEDGVGGLMACSPELYRQMLDSIAWEAYAKAFAEAHAPRNDVVLDHMARELKRAG